MKKICLFVLFFINLLFVNAQDFKSSLIKDIFPAAPTSNNLMKFEEVPVNYYTGVPNINIPLYNFGTRSSTTNLNISLNYHPYTAKPKDKSSEVGLGWSLNYGGTITRTVRSIPDESNFIPSNPGAKIGIGIYFDEYTNRFADKNFAAKFIELKETSNNLSSYQNQIGKLFYESYYFNRFDTQYDLYQYNFFGHSGRFIVKKDKYNKFYVEKLDVDNLKIECNFDPITFIPISFKIIDEFGKSYIFDITERTNTSNLTERNSFKGKQSLNERLGYNIKSSFHLSEVLDQNISLIKFNYKPSSIINYSESSNLSRYVNGNLDGIPEENLPAQRETNSTNYNIETRLIDNIEIIGRGKITFDYATGREDTNYGNGIYKLNTISIVDNSNKVLNKYTFNYGYFNFKNSSIGDINNKRLKLINIDYYENDKKMYDYIFDYYKNNKNSYSIDKWGWFNCGSSSLDLDPNPECISENLIKTIKLPTGGIQYYNFGINTYSYKHNGQIIPPVYEVIDQDLGTTYFTKNELNKIQNLFELDSTRYVEFDVYANQLNNIPWQLNLYKDGISTNQSIGNIAGDSNYNPYHKIQLEKGSYTGKLIIYQPGFILQENISIASKTQKKILINRRYKLGGGVRINSINYFVSENDFINGSPDRSINYSYNDSINNSISSGSLVFPEPVHSFTYYYEPAQRLFNIFSTENFIPSQKTKGGDVGYNQIMISEIYKGDSSTKRVIYTSPKDFPNLSEPNILPPFKPIQNYDYKRGIVLSEKLGNSSQIFQDKKYLNDFILEKDKITGISVAFLLGMSTDFLHSSKFDTYEKYITYCADGSNMFCFQGAQNPISFLNGEIEKEAMGTNSLKNEKKIEIFTHNKISTNIDFQYSSNNPLLVSKQSTQNSKGESLTTNYQYPSDLVSGYEQSSIMQEMVNRNMIATPIITKSKNGSTVLSEQRTLYKYFPGTNGNLILPEFVYGKKGENTTASDRKITYNSYDEKGNLTQYTLENGIPVSIIWGYNAQYPILKVEGVALKDIPQWLIDYLKSPSDAGHNTELATRLNYQRNEPYFKDAMVTGYVYQPLVGVTQIIQPNGQTEYYKYDAANRLEEIRNDKQEVLKTFEYNYKQP